MTIKISQSDYDTLKWAGKKYYVVPGHKPMPPESVLADLVKKLRQEMDPPVYQTPGFDRQ